ncbi:PAS domain-containing hybrid sensor histidine kinase/response regulator [Methylotenera sp. G11]|uniref:PAS domain-containing hybrid sensor histidine kinase/response regulator n=1 Tax=Methylotenera sp. G11 TaxID=1506585 RepID=UPI00068C9A1D|nr:PAS domain-containing hybrid sensor histidine kinase/response regulator [Methylotenera sp. G11]
MKLLKRKNSIVRYLIVTILVLVTVLLTGLGVFIDRHISSQETDSLTVSHLGLADSLASSLSSALWDSDYPQLETIAASAFSHADVHGVTVQAHQAAFTWARDEAGYVQKLSHPVNPKGLIAQNRVIISHSQEVGTVTLYFTSKWVDQDIRKTRWFILGAIAFIDLSLMIGLYIALKWTVLKPLLSLENYAKDPKSEDAKDALLNAPFFVGELASLRESLLDMVSDVRKKNEALIQSADRMKKLIEYFPIPVALINDTGISYLNDAATTTFGYQEDDLPSFDQWFLKAYPDAGYRHLVLSKLESDLGNAKKMAEIFGNAIVPTAIYKIATRSGVVRDVELGGMHTSENCIVFLMDVTERVKYENTLTQYRYELEELVEQRTSELESARIQAELASQAKSIFLSNMSHELRTPLNSVIGYSQLLMRDATFDSRQKIKLDTIYSSANHLLNLINSVLEISKIEAGATSLTMEHADIRAIVVDTVEMMRVRSDEKNIQLVTDIGALPPMVIVDAFKLKQVLLNLVCNAIKFTHAGRVTLRVNAKPQGNQKVSLSFYVIDTGQGIPADDMNRIFSPFVQLDSPTRHTGTGLGLSISKKFIEVMGGEIKVESAENLGSKFYFSLNLAIGNQEGRKKLFSWSDFINRGIGRKILVVDDTDHSRSLLIQLLMPLGADIVEAASGNEARLRIAEDVPDFIFMDWRMKDGDGLSAIQWLRQQPIKQPRVAMMTANAFSEDKPKAIAAGADDFLIKPINESSLHLVLADFLNLKPTECETLACNALDADASSYISMLKELAPHQLESLVEAAMQLDTVMIRQAIRGIEAEQPELAVYLSMLNESLQYKRLWHVLEISDILIES